MKLFYNANIYTLDEKQPKASAVLIAGARIIAVGDKDQLELYSGARQAGNRICKAEPLNPAGHAFSSNIMRSDLKR